MILDQLESKCINLHNTQRYHKFIILCLQQNANLDKSVYLERHHILPKSIWPEYKDLRSCKWNCARLTARQHFIAHKFLAKALGKSMWQALLSLYTLKNKRRDIKHIYKTSSKEYEKCKSEWISFYKTTKHYNNGIKEIRSVFNNQPEGFVLGRLTNNTKDQIWINNGIEELYIKNWSDIPIDYHEGRILKDRKTCERCSKEVSHNTYFQHHGQRCEEKLIWVNDGSKTLMVSKDSIPEGFKKGRMSISCTRTEMVCPHCSKIGKGPNMKRYHFDNCKQKPV